MFNKLLKSVVGIAIETPIAIAADIVTLGGVLTDTEEPYTATAAKKVLGNIQDITNGDGQKPQ